MLRQSGDLLLAQAREQVPPDSDQVQRALMWLDKYCGRFPTPAREVLQAQAAARCKHQDVRGGSEVAPESDP